jgi:hypothetical protein
MLTRLNAFRWLDFGRGICFRFSFPLLCALFLTTSCVSRGQHQTNHVPPAEAVHALQQLKAKYAPANQFGVYAVGLSSADRQLVLTGIVDNLQASKETGKTIASLGLTASNTIRVLPEASLGERTWGVACLSVASARELPDHKAELGMQVLMGGSIRVLQRGTNAMWYYIQSPDGYCAWLERGTFSCCTQSEAEAWAHSPLLFVSALEEVIWSKPDRSSEPVSDVVLADLVKKTGEQGDWYQVELPDKRAGFLPRTAAEDYAAWKLKRRPSPENIERSARMFLGRPYLWGGDSPKGFDCSGFTHMVFFLNGIELSRNSSQQARQGVDVRLDANLSGMARGDLLFFGVPARGELPERIHHVGIYLGNKLFIHSSERVQINSLDPESPIRDEHRIRTLLRARRVLSLDGVSAVPN